MSPSRRRSSWISASERDASSGSRGEGGSDSSNANGKSLIGRFQIEHRDKISDSAGFYAATGQGMPERNPIASPSRIKWRNCNHPTVLRALMI